MAPSRKAPHPGRVLQSDYLEAHGLSQYRLAVDIGVPPRRINEIVLEKRGITADTALRLGRYFGIDPLVFTELQTRWELAEAARRLGDRLDAEVTPLRVGRPAPTGRRKTPPKKKKPQAPPEAAPARRKPAATEEHPTAREPIEDYLL